jgi:GPH family glycoside/pentoside/hexuronide:cation symporter
MVPQSAVSEFSVHFLNAKPPSYTLLPRGVILAYAVPRIAFGIMGTLFVVYFMKFATDVLLIAPAVIGTILAIGRLWDGITDPIIGYFIRPDPLAHRPATALVILRGGTDGLVAHWHLVAA